MSSKGPNLKTYLDKTISLQLNRNRRVSGVLRGYDQFMNLVLGDAVEEVAAGQTNKIGMVVIRGNSIVQVKSSFVLCTAFMIITRLQIETIR